VTQNAYQSIIIEGRLDWLVHCVCSGLYFSLWRYSSWQRRCSQWGIMHYVFVRRDVWSNTTEKLKQGLCL